MSDLTKADLRERLGNIDQIRDILFGPQLREYSTRLEQVERDLATAQQEFRNRSEEIRQSILAELQTTVETIDKRIRALTLKDEEEKFDIRQQIEAMNKRIANTAEELQESIAGELDDLADNAEKRFKVLQARDSEEKFEIRQQLELLSKRLSGNIEALDENLDQQTSALHDNLQETQEKFQTEITDLRTQIFEELERYCSMLSQVKVSRDDMAELLFELGLRLKGSEFVPELKEAAQLVTEPRTLLENEAESVAAAPSPPEESPEAPAPEDEETEEAQEPEPSPRKSSTTRRGRPGRLK
ncbi:MAG: hypothetical protein ACO31I_16505 [Prochlorotrichaceae cyanobacterium]|jgi:hypothetical protein